jgi:nucleoside phosphorylase
MVMANIGMINNGTAHIGGDVVGKREAPAPTPSRAPARRRTVLVICALISEFDAAREAATGHPGVTRWSPRDEDSDAPYLSGEYVTPDGGRIDVALARPTRMGGRSVAPLATALADRLSPLCIAMSGVCAGNPAQTVLGDVVIADRVYEYDEGKIYASAFVGDHQQYPLDNRWLRAAQDFGRDRRLPYAVRVGPMASGSAVVEDREVWTRLTAMGIRTITALDMEAATIATVAHNHRIPHWLIVKGVMDHAEAGRDDGHKASAERNSAEVLWALLARLVRPASAERA